jgi:hypothetical protein
MNSTKAFDSLAELEIHMSLSKGLQKMVEDSQNLDWFRAYQFQGINRKQARLPYMFKMSTWRQEISRAILHGAKLLALSPHEVPFGSEPGRLEKESYVMFTIRGLMYWSDLEAPGCICLQEGDSLGEIPALIGGSRCWHRSRKVEVSAGESYTDVCVISAKDLRHAFIAFDVELDAWVAAVRSLAGPDGTIVTSAWISKPSTSEKKYSAAIKKSWKTSLENKLYLTDEEYAYIQEHISKNLERTRVQKVKGDSINRKVLEGGFHHDATRIRHNVQQRLHFCETALQKILSMQNEIRTSDMANFNCSEVEGLWKTYRTLKDEMRHAIFREAEEKRKVAKREIVTEVAELSTPEAVLEEIQGTKHRLSKLVYHQKRILAMLRRATDKQFAKLKEAWRHEATGGGLTMRRKSYLQLRMIRTRAGNE